MKKTYIVPSMKESNPHFTKSVCQIYKGSLDGIVPETSEHTPGAGNNGVNNTYSSDQYSNERGGFGSDSGPWESLW